MKAFKNTLAVCLLAAGGAVAWVASSHGSDQVLLAQKSTKEPVGVVISDTPVAREGRMSGSYAPIVKKVAPSVVYVFSSKTVKNPNPQMLPFFNDPFFRRFFGDQDGEDGGRRQQQPRTHKERSLGSGVIVSKDGYILTNNHVVDGADEIKVSLAQSKTEYLAKVIGRDPMTDVAVLKIDKHDLPFITLADSDKVEVGDIALAIGNPFGIGQTVTAGIVSAIGRGGFGVEAYEDFIQTDAAINPGNSGGPLVDEQGRLIGINTFIISGSGGNQGVGFAIPVNLARNVMEQLTKTGQVVRGFLGVVPEDVTPALAKSFDLAEVTGALVDQVEDNSPAADAGLKAGDIIVEFDGKAIKDSRNLRLTASRTTPGTKVALKVIRDGKPMTMQVTLKEFPTEKLAGGSNSKENENSTSDALNGVEVGDLTRDARQQLRVPDQIKGALITNIDPNSASYDGGLREGDVILEINHKPVHNADEAVKASERVKSKQVLVRIWRRGVTRYIPIDESDHH